MKLYTMITIVLAGMFLTGCGKNSDTVVVGTPPVVVDEVKRVVDEYNDAKLVQGQTSLLVPGLSCSLYNNTGGGGVFPTGSSTFPTTLPAVVASFQYVGTINQPDSSANDGLNILPSGYRSLYTSWYAVRCTGQVIVTSSDFVSMSLRSDDVGMLYVDNVLMTGLNSTHNATTTTGVRYLARGVHSVRLDFMQAGGDQSLQLSVPGSYLYH